MKQSRSLVSRGAHLAAAAREGLGRDVGAQDLELDVADGLVAQRALSRAPLEPLRSMPRETHQLVRGRTLTHKQPQEPAGCKQLQAS